MPIKYQNKSYFLNNPTPLTYANRLHLLIFANFLKHNKKKNKTKQKLKTIILNYKSKTWGEKKNKTKYHIIIQTAFKDITFLN